ncbi:MAG: phosphotransferase [Lachnospiraceae bacterium]|nr:phosphotransferase [Lachnospiraceae bacterium]
MDNRIKKILINWKLQDSSIKQVYETAWQAGESYILKEYRDLKMLKRNLEIINILDKMNIPVGKIIPPALKDKNIQYIEDEGSFYFLSQKLPGCHLTETEDVKNTAFKIGMVIARLHAAFKICEENGTFWNNSLLGEMNGWVKKNFEDSGWKYISLGEYEETVSKLECLYDDLPIQLIHRDVHLGNFLFDGREFSGYIDFDLSQKNIRIFDICYFLAGILSEEEKIKISGEQWFGFVGGCF